MTYASYYNSPLGEILIAATENGIVGIWFAGQKYFAEGIDDYALAESENIREAKRWLDIYFTGEEPDFKVRLDLRGTPFRQAVWEALLSIPYGKTVTYGNIAAIVAAKTGKKCSARAVGGAVGHNPASILVPCHRVVGADGSLTGYAGGMERKTALLSIEGVIG